MFPNLRFLLITLVLAVACESAFSADKEKAKSEKSVAYYSELVGSVNPVTGAIQVSLDMGRVFSARTGVNQLEIKQKMEALKYNSLVDVLNALTPYGWRLVETYTVTVRNQTAVHWVITKEAQDPHELLDGILD